MFRWPEWDFDWALKFPISPAEVSPCRHCVPLEALRPGNGNLENSEACWQNWGGPPGPRGSPRTRSSPMRLGASRRDKADEGVKTPFTSCCWGST